MNGIVASWAVEYTDGSYLSQYDTDGTERPYRSIEWDRVQFLVLESQLLRQTFDIHPDPTVRLSLRSRHFMTVEGDGTLCFMLVGSDPAASEVNVESTRWALYWFPDGVYHVCDQFDCRDVRAYGSGLLHGIPRGLMPEHHHLRTAADGALEA